MQTGIRNPVVITIFYAILLLWSVSVIYPLIWTVLDAFKDNEQFFLGAPWSLPKLPLLWENFDLMMRQRSYFKPALQTLMGFFSQPHLKQRANALTGYDTTPAGKIRYFA